MRVAIDARVVSPGRSGVGEYTYQLLRQFPFIDKELEYFIFLKGSSVEEKRIKELSSSFNIEKISPCEGGKFLNFIKTHGEIPVRLLFLKPRLFHSPGPIAPFVKTCRTVLTIHDLSFLKVHGIFDKFQNTYYKTFVPHIARKVDKIITVSNNAAGDIVELLHIPEEKIRVIYNGVDERFSPERSAEREHDLKKRFGLSDYILFLGVLEPRKNVSRLIRAYSRLSPELSHYKLVIAGGHGWLYEDIYSLVKELSLQNRVIFTGRISDEDLPDLYRGASLFVYPSLMEGFGIPPLEAMACGIPVIASNTSSFPEVLSDAAFLVDPLNEEEITSAMTDILTDKNLCKTLIYKGLKRASLFSWKESARRTLELYRELL